MFPILTAAVVPNVQLPPEGMPEALVQQADCAFVEAVERAFARGASRQSARAAAPGGGSGANETATGAWAAGLNFQPVHLPLAQDEPSWNASSAAENPAVLPANFAGAAHSLRMASLFNPAAMNAAAASQTVSGAAMGDSPDAGASTVQTALADVAARAKAGNAASQDERPIPAGFLQPGSGETNAANMASSARASEAENPSTSAFSAAQSKAARTAAKAKPAPLREADATQQADPAWAADTQMAAQQMVADVQQTGAQPEAVQGTSAQPEAVMAVGTGTQQRDAAMRTGVRPEGAVRDASAQAARAAIMSAGPAAAPGETAAPQTIAAQAANTHPDTATLPTADIAVMAQAPHAGAAPEPAAARRAERKGLDAARAISAQPQDSAAQAGQYARTQAAAQQENAYKGQALKPEPDAERDQDAARSRPVGGRQQAAPGAFPTVGEGPGSPPAEQAASPAPAGGQHTPVDLGPSAQLGRAALNAARRGETRFHLKLRPEGVGEVAVTISAKDNDLRLSIRTGSESTRELILSQIDGLKQELTQGGYHLEGFSVDVSGGQSGQSGQSFAFRQDPGSQPERQPDARPQTKTRMPTPKEARFPREPEARIGSINVRI